MRCPVDKDQLIILEYDDVELDYCATCRGLWLDGGELALLLGDDEVAGRIVRRGEVTGREKHRRCPECGTRMHKRATQPPHAVVYDVCPRDCGMWFDAGELQTALGHGGDDAEAEALRAWLHEVFGDETPTP